MSARSGGRLRSASARMAVMTATRDLLAEVGYEALTMQGIASRAGVGRQTVYRWWATKGQVVAEAALDGYVDADVSPPSVTDDLHEDLAVWLTGRLKTFSGDDGGSLLRALTAASVDDEDIAAQLFSRFTGPMREGLLERLRIARGAGVLRDDADLEGAVDALLGGLVVRLLTRVLDTGVDRIHGLLDVTLRGIT